MVIYLLPPDLLGVLRGFFFVVFVQRWVRGDGDIDAYDDSDINGNKDDNDDVQDGNVEGGNYKNDNCSNSCSDDNDKMKMYNCGFLFRSIESVIEGVFF